MISTKYNPSGDERDYVDIQDHGLIGNLHTAAMISVDGSVESYCVPDFDSPSVFARILDKNKGGHFSVMPQIKCTTKQGYLPSSNVLATKFLSNEGVLSVTDFLPRKKTHGGLKKTNHPMQNWLVRRVEVIRGSVPVRMECAPAFNYARDEHTMEIVNDDSISPLANPQQKVVFRSKNLSMDLRYVIDSSLERQTPEHARKPVKSCELKFEELDLRPKGHLGLSAAANLTLHEGNVVTFILRDLPRSSSRANSLADNALLKEAQSKEEEQEAVLRGASALRPNDDPLLTADLANELLEQTNDFWTSWINRSTYTGLWREAVHRSALALKLLTYEPTGAIVASPTFSLPEFIGGTRNWDYRASWIRDASFTLYALIRLGFTEEANAYMEFIYKRLEEKNEDGSLQIMYTIHGGRDLPEFELDHLEGHKESRPVRVGNGAANHLQLDIYGELMDCIYLSNKFGRPIGYDVWLSIREMIEYVIRNYKRPDLSIWEVRSAPQNFVYSKVMMWVAIDRGLRLADKRSLPCPRRNEWLQARDELYEEIMTKGWNKEKGFFGQSYENLDVLDASLLVMPLVFFACPTEPRFLSTLRQIMKSPEQGGLTANNLVFRYDTTKAQDGVGGEEGAFSLTTLWAVEALGRAGQYEPELLNKAVAVFEDFLGFGNHCGLFSEEISAAGEGLGNAVQGFTHVTLISAAYNLSRTLKHR
ncbi:hypothetical protein M407DRAFT_243709, partial [Tulasnella calospora MUT 4182]